MSPSRSPRQHCDVSLAVYDACRRRLFDGQSPADIVDELDHYLRAAEVLARPSRGWPAEVLRDLRRLIVRHGMTAEGVTDRLRLALNGMNASRGERGESRGPMTEEIWAKQLAEEDADQAREDELS